MKNLIFISLLLLPQYVFSQYFTFSRIDPYPVFGPATEEIKSHAIVRNLTTANDTLHIEIINRSVTSGWDSIGMCTWRLCYGSGFYTINEVLPPGTNSDTFYIYFNPNSIPGNGSCSVRMTYRTTVITQDFAVVATPIGIKQISSVVKDFSLGQNYPNPFNPVTNINFSIPKKESVYLRIYDIVGREVKTLINQEMAAGEYQVDFDANQLSSGMYYYSLRAGDNVSVKKMVLVK